MMSSRILIAEILFSAKELLLISILHLKILI
jgi:hypothetical protein